jgi:C4-dicarboxylate-binding protein DctP
MFDDEAQAERVMNGPIGTSLLKKLEPKGITGLGYWNNGFYVMTANRPLHHVADFRGLKLRVQSSKVSEAEVRALGANPQVLAFSEVYQALQTGVVDGADYPTLSNLYTQKIYEVQKHITLSDHSYLGYAVIMNKNFWDGLPENLRAVIRGAIKDSTAYNNKLAKQETEDLTAKIKATGKTTVYALTPAEKMEWKKAMVKVHDEMAGRIGRDLINSIYKETGFDPKK